MLAVPRLPRHQGIPGKLGFPQEKHRGSTVKTLFSSYFHRDVVLSGRVSSSRWSQGSLGFHSVSFRKGTPKCRDSLKPLGHKDYRRHQRRQSNSISQHPQASRNTLKRELFWDNLSKIHKWRFLKAQGREEKKKKKKGLGGMGNYFKPSPNLVQDAKMPRTIRAGAYFYSASP